ncbi:MAG: hypothetical protein MUC87_22205 [Bacteroidia bacterium]|jgi:DNA mismatch repair ATPase MutS|nr:hypothetical protein [Bacteroidia bacterium]
MMKNLSWKRKNQLLLAGAVALLWIVYSYAVTNTLNARRDCQKLQQRIDSAASAPQQLAALRAQMEQLKNTTGVSDSSAAAHEKLLDIVTHYCEQNNLVLRDFSPAVNFVQQDWSVDNHPVTVEGNFSSLLRLVHHLEGQEGGNVISTEFRSRRDNKTQALSLSLVIYIQTISNSKS